MSSLWVVLDTRSDSSAWRVGRVEEPDDVAANALELTVVWPDGGREFLKLSPTFRKLRLDALSAFAILAPDQLAQELKSSPLVFARALAEKPRGYFRSGDLLQIVSERAGVDKAVVDKAWRSQKRAFEALDEVHVEPSGSGAKYQLRQPLPPVKLPGFDAGMSEVLAEHELAQTVADEVPTEGAEVTEDSLVEEVGSSAGDSAKDEPEGVPVELATVEPQAELDIADILSLRQPSPIDPERVEAWLATDAPASAIADGATALERLRNNPDAYAQRLVGFSFLVSRLLKYPNVKIPPEALARAFVALRRSELEGDRKRALEALERSVSVLNKSSAFLSAIDKPAFQQHLAELPLVDGGVRARFLVLLARSNKSEVEDPGWWRGFGWPDVPAIASGPLSTVVSSSEDLLLMVRRVVDEFAQHVTTRSSLAALLSAPRFAIEHVTPEQMVSIFERVTKNDTVFAGWHAALSGVAERMELTKRTLAAEEEARSASAARAAAVTEKNDLSAQLARVQEQVTALQSHAAALTDRERRQVLIDAAKVVAQVAATVEGEGRALDHDALSRKVSGLAEKFGLLVHARTGEMTAFDASQHRAPGERPQDGEIVNVARTGYTWEEGGERVVVLPALVTRMSESQESA